ncbi:polysaccharide biosynthesis/export family protein [Mucilaginibacter gotjawali]|uniref:Polysaccharide biosynthesis/export protein n=2 Tax=Mucilaginibacter gotjawali TaxID=1550579 RepID=A0A0X8X4C7_9SPHI|nr:polysaccharide biosynthesis/export family protein [Mucilaginibacter gotjawali]MBB3057496.1 polysaccharide export outer membrane protein [Mucilaginibacter gotjawali]BAU55385.1 Polysaccharide biosynthesis/export protein [Mucilaginibacter gotjawali]
MKNNFYIHLLAFFAGAIIFSSCSPHVRTKYFEDFPDSGASKHVVLPNFKAPLIEPDDILSITIQTVDPLASLPVNQAAASSFGAANQGTQQIISGYLVNSEGMVQIPMIGKIKLSGLTTTEASNLIAEKAKYFLKMPSVQVRFANYKVTVLGEVTHPSSYVIPNERFSVMDAIGLAGDLTINGKRDNILLVRDSLGEKVFVRLNLLSTNIYKSRYFYLKNNDLIYVEPNKIKSDVEASTKRQNIQLVLSVITVLTLILIRFK